MAKLTGTKFTISSLANKIKKINADTTFMNGKKASIPHSLTPRAVAKTFKEISDASGVKLPNVRPYPTHINKALKIISKSINGTPPVNPNAPVFIGPDIPDINGEVGVPITQYDASVHFSTLGDAPAYFFVAGTDPNGLTITTGSGTIQGSPVAEGTFPLQVSATNPDGQARSNVFNLIAAAPTTPADPIFDGTVPDLTGTVGTPFSYDFSQHFDTGGPVSEYYQYFGVIPSGLTLDPVTGVLSGTPDAETDTIKNRIGAKNHDGSFSITTNEFGYKFTAAPPP